MSSNSPQIPTKKYDMTKLYTFFCNFINRTVFPKSLNVPQFLLEMQVTKGGQDAIYSYGTNFSVRNKIVTFLVCSSKDTLLFYLIFLYLGKREYRFLMPLLCEYRTVQ